MLNKMNKLEFLKPFHAKKVKVMGFASVAGILAALAGAGISAVAVGGGGAGGATEIIVQVGSGQDAAVTNAVVDALLGSATSGGICGGGAGGGFTFTFVVGAVFCHVAREVYGADNYKWMQFREWVINNSPKYFKYMYGKYGERFAKFISNKPNVKYFIRLWMDYIISKNNLENKYCFSF